jgi:hypothetical protein
VAGKLGRAYQGGAARDAGAGTGQPASLPGRAAAPASAGVTYGRRREWAHSAGQQQVLHPQPPHAAPYQTAGLWWAPSNGPVSGQYRPIASPSPAFSSAVSPFGPSGICDAANVKASHVNAFATAANACTIAARGRLDDGMHASHPTKASKWQSAAFVVHCRRRCLTRLTPPAHARAHIHTYTHAHAHPRRSSCRLPCIGATNLQA